MNDPSLHLFIDNQHIRNAFALERLWGSLQRHEAPLMEDIPGRLVAWGSVMQETNGLFRCWYQSIMAGSFHDVATAGVWGRGDDFGYYPDRHPMAVPFLRCSVVSYAESQDGVAWVKPELGLHEWQGNTRNNIVLDGSGAERQFEGRLTNMDTISVLRDEDEADPAARYKMICHWENSHIWDNIVSHLDRSEDWIKQLHTARAKYMNTSPDGIHWNAPLVHIKNCAAGGDYAGVTRDERNRRYWFNDRAGMGLPGLGCRLAGLCISSDLYHWPSTVEQVLAPGPHEDYGRRYEHHGMIPFNYGDQDLAALEISLKGYPIASVLASHRDGERWQLPNNRTPFFTVGTAGSFDETIMAVTRNAPFRVGNRLRFYYNGRRFPDQNGDRTGHLGMAEMRLDGFAGMTADPMTVRRFGLPAMLQTQPIVVREDTLELNIEGHERTARVSLQHPDMSPVQGCDLNDCLPLPEDGVRIPVRWKNRTHLQDLKGMSLCVLVQFRSGTLWSVRL
jgi:hypothetical protein